jgi:hypothetical protein
MLSYQLKLSFSLRRYKNSEVKVKIILVDVNTCKPHGIPLANIVYVHAFSICYLDLMMTPSQGRNM